MSAPMGKRIAAFRNKNNLSLEDLSERTGLDVQFLQAVEENDVYPSLGPLIKIARSLGLRLGTLLDDQMSVDPLIVKLEERTDEITTHQAMETPAEVVFYSLGKGKTDRHMEPFFVELLPESGKDKKLSSHEGEEFVVVISGQVALVYGQETKILSPGDSVYYNSVVPHHMGCHGDQKAEIYAVIYIPE